MSLQNEYFEMTDVNGTGLQIKAMAQPKSRNRNFRRELLIVQM